MRYTLRTVTDPTPQPETNADPQKAFARQRLVMVGGGVLLGWALFNLYLADGAERLHGSPVRMIAILVALVMFTLGYQLRRVVAGSVAALIVLSAVALARSTGSVLIAALVGWVVGEQLARGVKRTCRQGVATVFGYALCVTAAWAIVLWAAIRGDWVSIPLTDDPDSYERMKRAAAVVQVLQALLAPVLAWIAAAMWFKPKQTDRRLWALLVLGLSLVIGVTFALGLEQTFSPIEPPQPPRG